MGKMQIDEESEVSQEERRALDRAWRDKMLSEMAELRSDHRNLLAGFERYAKANNERVEKVSKAVFGNGDPGLAEQLRSSAKTSDETHDVVFGKDGAPGLAENVRWLGAKVAGAALVVMFVGQLMVPILMKKLGLAP